jgi:hypothetical protein
MSYDVDPFIRRELQWMAQGVLADQDLAPIILKKVRRRRIKRALIIGGSLVVAVALSFGIYAIASSAHSSGLAMQSTQTIQGTSSAGGSGSGKPGSLNPANVVGVTSDYPLTWEQSVGDLSAISRAGGLGDTLGGLTAVGLKVTWQRCSSGQCPTSWILNLKNNTGDIVSASPALMIFVDHSPVTSTSRPVTVTPGGSSLVVFTYPEFTQSLTVDPSASWQWNWYLTVAR